MSRIFRSLSNHAIVGFALFFGGASCRFGGEIIEDDANSSEEAAADPSPSSDPSSSSSPSPSPATRTPYVISVYGGNNQTGGPASTLSSPIQVRVLDALGDPVVGETVQWAVTGGGGSLSGATSSTNSEGIAAINWTLGDHRSGSSSTNDTNGTNSATAALSSGASVNFGATSIICTASAIAASPFASGSTGASNDPYYICTSTQLNQIGGDVGRNSKHYKLGQSIDLTGVSYTMIGDAAFFTGTFNGNGYSLTNLNVASVTQGAAFIKGTSTGAVVKNLSISIDEVSAPGVGDVAGLIGYATGTTVTNCHISPADGSSVISGSGSVGGLIGIAQDNVSVSISSSTVPVSGSVNVGGLIGYTDGSGIAVSVTNSFAGGSVTASGGWGAGFIGNSTAGVTVTNAYSRGVVSGGGANDGFMGSNSATVNDSFWDTETSTKNSDASAATGRNTAQMKTPSTFTGAGWDTSIWNFAAGSYPTLR